MSDNELNSLGRILAGILRHFPEKFKLEMDGQGWIVINALIQAVRRRASQFHWLRPHHILALVETDPKGRYEIRNNLIRATYGHSIDVDLDLPTDDIPEKLYYPTTTEEVELLMETGLKPSDRKKVHLSKTSEDAENAGKYRVPNPIILEIDAKGSIQAGNIIQHAATTVFITAEISPEFIRVIDSTLSQAIMHKKTNEKDIIKTPEEPTEPQLLETPPIKTEKNEEPPAEKETVIVKEKEKSTDSKPTKKTEKNKKSKKPKTQKKKSKKAKSD
jgi:putative RNA 2'-phosphotransferase